MFIDGRQPRYEAELLSLVTLTQRPRTWMHHLFEFETRPWTHSGRMGRGLPATPATGLPFIGSSGQGALFIRELGRYQ